MTDALNWLMLIHQLPPDPAYLRVKVSRRLQRVGAVLLKNSVAALPDTDECREHFAWIAQEIATEGGEASVLAAQFIAGLDDEQMKLLFRSAREQDYRRLLEDARELASVPATPENAGKLRKDGNRLRKRLAELRALDYFQAGDVSAVLSALDALDNTLNPLLSGTARPESRSAAASGGIPRGAEWITRAGLGVDRMACAWLIRRWLDPDARFVFVQKPAHKPRAGQVRFDMFQAEFTHQGDACTFEVLLREADLRDPALQALAEIVHDLDLKDAKFGRPETDGIGRILAGLTQRHRDDEARLEAGCRLFEDLYASFGGRFHPHEHPTP